MAWGLGWGWGIVSSNRTHRTVKKGGNRRHALRQAVAVTCEALERRTLLTATPIAQWHFNENTGTTAADNIGGDTATLVGTSWISPSRLSAGLSLNGSTNYLSVASSTALRLSGSISVSAWVNFTNTGNNVIASVVNNSTGGYRLYTSGGKAVFDVRSSTNGVLNNASVSGGTNLSSTVGSEAWNSRDLKSRPH